MENISNPALDRFMAEWQDKLDILRADDDGMPEHPNYEQTIKAPREHKSQAELLQETIAMAAQKFAIPNRILGRAEWWSKSDDYKRLELQAFQELNRASV